MAYIQMNCPHCNHTVDYVYVQVGQLHCCKKCNQEFALLPRRHNYFAIASYIVGGIMALAIAGFVVVKFFNWYVYRK
jgi:hypothetical protein